MSLHVLNAHTGQQYDADLSSFAALESLKSWLGQVSGIATTQQILLTGEGKQVKLQSLREDNDIFLYNRQLLSSSAKTNRRHSLAGSPPKVAKIGDYPQDVIQAEDLEGWQNLFERRQDWARDVQDKAEAAVFELLSQRNALAAIQKATEVALGNLHAHVSTLDDKQKEAADWADNLLKEQDAAVEAAQVTYPYLDLLPARTDLVRYLAKPDQKETLPQDEDIVLGDFVSAKQYQDARAAMQETQTYLRKQSKTMREAVSKVVDDTETIIKAVESSRSANETSGNVEQMEEINVLCDKIVSDCSHVTELIADGKADTQPARIASMQDKNYLSLIMEYYDEISKMLEKARSQWKTTTEESLRNMQNIARTEAAYASAQALISNFDMTEDGAHAFETISNTSQLPLAYGMLMVEAVRHTEWVDNHNGKGNGPPESRRAPWEDEEKRQKKWLKAMERLVGDVKISVGPPRSGKEYLPQVTKDELGEYLDAIATCRGLPKVFDKLIQAVKDNDQSGTKLARSVSGFRAGSIHENGKLSNSVLGKQGEEISILKVRNQMLEEELKGQKSRVRKLEHLVFSQSQTSRAASSHLFQVHAPRPVETPAPSPDPMSPLPSPKTTTEHLSRKASVNSRRTSGHQSQEDKTLARRIVLLEAELHEQKQKMQVRDTEAVARKEEYDRMKEDLEQARMTNVDLMANMDDQQRGLADERRMLRDEVADWKSKLEDVEDELDRVVGSRRNEKTETDERVSHLQEHLEAAEDIANRHRELQEDHRNVLLRVHGELQVFDPTNNDTQTSNDLPDLVQSLGRLAEQATLHMNRLKDAVDVAKQDNQNLQHALDKQSVDNHRVMEENGNLQQELESVNGQLASQNARHAALESELGDARTQLRTLRAKFAEGETGSKALRQRLENQAAKAAHLTTSLAESQAEVDHLKHELSATRSRQSEKSGEVSAIEERLANRSIKDMEISKRLAGYVNELARLLELLGLCVLEREDGAMSIQRTSKLASMSQTLSDSTAIGASANTLGRTVDLNVAAKLLNWVEADSAADEDAQFTIFLSRIDTLDLPALSEAILKLRRDVEHTGRKWKNEAKQYREKWSNVQPALLDAARKIAFRDFKDGDLALFLPTRNQAIPTWAAFNVGAPHYFLRESDSHKLQSREWLVARISSVQELTVDNRKMAGGNGVLADAASSSNVSFDDDNPFDLPDGTRWYYVDATEEKLNTPLATSAPRTTSILRGKTAPTVASACVNAQGTCEKLKSKEGDASSKLGKSLESRRSSTTSKAGSIRATKDGASDASVKVDVPSTIREAAKKTSKSSLRSAPVAIVQNKAGAPISSGLGIEMPQPEAEGLGSGLAAAGQYEIPSLPTPASRATSKKPEPPRRTLSHNVKPTTTSAFFSQTFPEADTSDATPTVPTLSKNNTTRITSPPKAPKTKGLKSSNISPRRSPAKEAPRAASALALTHPVTDPSTHGGEQERGWKSLWSLDVSIEEEKRREAS